VAAPAHFRTPSRRYESISVHRIPLGRLCKTVILSEEEIIHFANDPTSRRTSCSPEAQPAAQGVLFSCRACVSDAEAVFDSRALAASEYIRILGIARTGRARRQPCRNSNISNFPRRIHIRKKHDWEGHGFSRAEQKAQSKRALAAVGQPSSLNPGYAEQYLYSEAFCTKPRFTGF
jgi:hypothetical protein